MLTDQEKWLAVLHCDPACDGLFFYGVRTTGVFCRPSCRSKTPRRENTEYFTSAEAARAAGLRPCKRCRPDLLEYAPAQELLRQAKSVLDRDDAERTAVMTALRQLPVSSHHLTRLFQAHFGLTPAQYLNRRRMEKARQFLGDSRLSIAEAAACSGFGSLSRFYASFRREFGVTPREYRLRTEVRHRLPDESPIAHI